MSKLLHILSQACSIVLYPMLMPLYGMLLFFTSTQTLLPLLPTAYIVIGIAGTMVLTLVIPIILLLYMWRKGYIDSLHMHDSKQRTTPYIYTLICYCFWAYFLHATLQLPIFMLLVAIGAIVALLIVTIINHWWKISAHLTGIGGLLGGMQFRSELLHTTYIFDYHSIATFLITHVCTSISECAYPSTGCLRLPIGANLYLHSYINLDLCVRFCLSYCCSSPSSQEPSLACLAIVPRSIC